MRIHTQFTRLDDTLRVVTTPTDDRASVLTAMTLTQPDDWFDGDAVRVRITHSVSIEAQPDGGDAVLTMTDVDGRTLLVALGEHYAAVDQRLAAEAVPVAPLTVVD